MRCCVEVPGHALNRIRDVVQPLYYQRDALKHLTDRRKDHANEALLSGARDSLFKANVGTFMQLFIVTCIADSPTRMQDDRT